MFEMHKAITQLADQFEKNSIQNGSNSIKETNIKEVVNRLLSSLAIESFQAKNYFFKMFNGKNLLNIHESAENKFITNQNYLLFIESYVYGRKYCSKFKQN